MLYNSLMPSVATYSLEQHYGNLDAAIARAPELDSLVNDMEAVLSRYRTK
jgi:hypothetical protein